RIQGKSLIRQARPRSFYPLLAVFGSALTACATPAPPEPIIITQRVDVPVMVPCVDPEAIPPVRLYADQRVSLTASFEEKADALMAGVTERDEDIPALRAALAGCVGD